MIDLSPLASGTPNVLASNYSLYTESANQSAIEPFVPKPRENGRVVRGAGGKKLET
jgi:hypothetical protein